MAKTRPLSSYRHIVSWKPRNVVRLAGMVEVEPNGVMWVHFSDQRMCYTTIQGKLKSVVHSVMVLHGFLSSWRG